MPWDEWTIDFRAMAVAYEAEKKGLISRDAWELSVWMKMKDGWTVIEHGKVSNPLSQFGMMEKLQVRQVSSYVAYTYDVLSANSLLWANDTCLLR
jgi:hypothetical protein